MVIVRAEAWLEVEVATPATVEVELLVEERTGRVVWGEEVEVLCSTTTPGNPPAILQLSLITANSSSSSSSEQPTLESQELAGPSLSASYSPALEESGARFGCRWWQLDPESGSILYHGLQLSPPLEVVMAPSLLGERELETSLLYYPGLTIAPQLRSRPVPEPSQVTWRLLTTNQSVLTPSQAAEVSRTEIFSQILLKYFHIFD